MQETIVITPAIRADYLKYKFELKDGLAKSINAIQKIRDGRLYVVEYRSFEAFCQAELNEARQRIDRLIVQSNINQDLSPIGIKVVESQARVLNQLDDPEDRRTAYHLAELKGSVTAETLRSTVKVVQDMRATGGYVDTGNGEMTPITAAVDTETIERLARHRQYAAEASQWDKPVVFEGSLINLEKFLDGVYGATDGSEIIKVTAYKRKEQP